MEHLMEWELAGETEVLGVNLPQYHFVLSCAGTRPAAVGSRRIIAWAMARPLQPLLPKCHVSFGFLRTGLMAVNHSFLIQGYQWVMVIYLVINHEALRVHATGSVLFGQLAFLCIASWTRMCVSARSNSRTTELIVMTFDILEFN
jgi:hypothetical protein